MYINIHYILFVYKYSLYIICIQIFIIYKEVIKNLDKIKQMQIVLTMYYRAEYNPYKTNDMIKAQNIFKKWLIKNGYKNSV